MAAALRPGPAAVSGTSPGSASRVTALHGTGLLAGALIMALLLSFARALLVGAGLRALLVIPAGLALVLAFMQCAGLPVPQSSWQVPEYWRRGMDPDILPVAYGAILGFGVFTSVVTAAFWVFAAGTVLYPVPLALAGWVTYAGARTAGFWFALRVPQLERILLTERSRSGLLVSATLIATLVVCTR
jgi:hypothetical protein